MGKNNPWCQKNNAGTMQKSVFPPKQRHMQTLPMPLRTPQVAQVSHSVVKPGWACLGVGASTTGAGWWEHQAPWWEPQAPLLCPRSQPFLLTRQCQPYLHSGGFSSKLPPPSRLWQPGLCCQAVLVSQLTWLRELPLLPVLPSPSAPAQALALSGSAWATPPCGAFSRLLEKDCLLRTSILQLLEASALC